ncbi:Sec-independent protein translocase protein TatB [Coralliovum pocilloporae]|uniref:Sec-independent protein translocase protein TatB n=1 Tax=Coralliovum pocilloporae TaxID=3066369 RepID=UPI0033079BC7
MFDIGWTELLVVAAVAILVVGPKDLPGMLRTFGRTFGNFKRMASDFQRQFNSALEEAELDQLQKELKEAQSIDPLAHLKKDLMDPIEETKSDINKNLNSDVSADNKTETAAETAAPAVSNPGPAGDQQASDDWSKRLDEAVSSPSAAAAPEPASVKNEPDEPQNVAGKDGKE